MNTQEIMQLALDMAGLDKTPADSTIYVAGENIARVLIGIDIGPAELYMAKQLGYDLVIAHHPVSLGRRLPGLPRSLRPHGGRRRASGRGLGTRSKPVVTTLELQDHVKNHDHVSSVAELLNLPFNVISTSPWMSWAGIFCKRPWTVN